MKSQKHLLSKLFISTLYLSAFTFGGGYVIITLMKKKFVDQYHWIDDEEMLDLIAIAQSSPGAIAVNGAIVVGYKLAGIPGVLLCVLATVLPPFVIISILSVFYAAFQSNVWIRLLLEGMQSGVAAVIASVVYDMGHGIIREKNTDFSSDHGRSISCKLYVSDQCRLHHFILYYTWLPADLVSEKEDTLMIYLQLFFSFLQIGTFSFGGGYAALPLIQNQVVSLHHWISMAEFTDLITISQMTPGPIAINSATFVGIKIAGMPGALVATLGCILPSCIIVTIIAYLYMRYRNLDTLQGILGMLRPAVVALIASAGISILITAFFRDSGIKLSSCNPKAVVIFAGCLILLRKRVNPVLVMVLAGIVNVGLSLFR